MLNNRLRLEGWPINVKRTYRLYCQEGLTVRKQRRKKLPVPERQPLNRPANPNEVWSMDFVFDELADGRRVKTLTVVDDCSKKLVRIVADTSIPGLYVTRMLDQIKAERGLPKVIGTDYGSESISKALDRWAYESGVELDFSRPGKPTANAKVESFNGRLREECLNAHGFLSLDDAKRKIEASLRYYNEVRPHTALDWATPAEFSRRSGLCSPLRRALRSRTFLPQAGPDLGLAANLRMYVPFNFTHQTDFRGHGMEHAAIIGVKSEVQALNSTVRDLKWSQENEARAQTTEIARTIIGSTAVLGRYIEQTFASTDQKLEKNNQQLKSLDGRVTELARLVDERLELLSDQMRVQKELSENVIELLKIPDFQKERRYFIEQGYKHYCNADKDPSLYRDALTNFFKAEAIEPTDQAVLHAIGMILLYAPEVRDPDRAADYFSRATKYGLADHHANETQLTERGPLDSLFQLGCARFAQEKFDAAIEAFDRGLKLYPSSLDFTFWRCKCLIANCQEDAALTALRPLLRDRAELLALVANDSTLSGAPAVLSYLEGWRDDVVSQIRNAIVEIEEAIPELRHASPIGGLVYGTLYALRAAQERNELLHALEVWRDHGLVVSDVLKFASGPLVKLRKLLGGAIIQSASPEADLQLYGILAALQHRYQASSTFKGCPAAVLNQGEGDPIFVDLFLSPKIDVFVESWALTPRGEKSKKELMRDLPAFSPEGTLVVDAFIDFLYWSGRDLYGASPHKGPLGTKAQFDRNVLKILDLDSGQVIGDLKLPQRFRDDVVYFVLRQEGKIDRSVENIYPKSSRKEWESALDKIRWISSEKSVARLLGQPKLKFEFSDCRRKLIVWTALDLRIDESDTKHSGYGRDGKTYFIARVAIWDIYSGKCEWYLSGLGTSEDDSFRCKQIQLLPDCYSGLERKSLLGIGFGDIWDTLENFDKMPPVEDQNEIAPAWLSNASESFAYTVLTLQEAKDNRLFDPNDRAWEDFVLTVITPATGSKVLQVFSEEEICVHGFDVGGRHLLLSPVNGAALRVVINSSERRQYKVGVHSSTWAAPYTDLPQLIALDLDDGSAIRIFLDTEFSLREEDDRRGHLIRCDLFNTQKGSAIAYRYHDWARSDSRWTSDQRVIFAYSPSGNVCPRDRYEARLFSTLLSLDDKGKRVPRQSPVDGLFSGELEAGDKAKLPQWLSCESFERGAADAKANCLAMSVVAHVIPDGKTSDELIKDIAAIGHDRAYAFLSENGNDGWIIPGARSSARDGIQLARAHGSTEPRKSVAKWIILVALAFTVFGGLFVAYSPDYSCRIAAGSDDLFCRAKSAFSGILPSK